MIPLKKDPLGMYSDLQINAYEALKKYTLDELNGIREWMSKIEAEVDAKGSSMEEIYETYGPDWEISKKNIDDLIKAYEIQKKDEQGESL